MACWIKVCANQPEKSEFGFPEPMLKARFGNMYPQSQYSCGGRWEAEPESPGSSFVSYTVTLWQKQERPCLKQGGK